MLEGRPHNIEKNVQGKYVTCNGEKWGYSVRGQWRWTAKAVQALNEEDLGLATAYVEAD